MIKELSKLLRDGETLVITLTKLNQHCRLCILPGGPVPPLTAVDKPESLDDQFLASVRNYSAHVIPMARAVEVAKMLAKPCPLDARPRPAAKPAPKSTPPKTAPKPRPPEPDLNDPAIFEAPQVVLDKDEHPRKEPEDHTPAVIPPDLTPAEPTDEELEALLGGESEAQALEEASAEGEPTPEVLASVDAELFGSV